MDRERTKAAMRVIKSNIATKGHHISKTGNLVTKLGKTEFKKEHWELGQIAIKQKRATNEILKKAKAFA